MNGDYKSKISSTRNYYEQNAEKYFATTFQSDMSDLWGEFEMHLPPKARILDLGCGSGRDTLHLSQRGYDVVGIDLSLNLLRKATRVTSQNFIVAEFQRLPFRDNEFDAVWAVGSLLHVPRFNVRLALAELTRVLNENGLLFTSMKEGNGDIVSSSGRYFVLYQDREWRSLLKENCLEIISFSKTQDTRTSLKGQTRPVSWLNHVAKISELPNKRV